MEREQAVILLKDKVKTLNLIKHCFACEAAMRELARYFQEDEKKWGLAGLLHDIDYEETKDNPKEHSLLGAQYLEEENIDEEIIAAVKTHNQIHGLAPETRMAKALFCVDPLTGLIVATTLVLPSKKIKEVSTDNVLNRFKEKGFARGANRETIQQCETLLGLTLEEFTKIALKGMQSVAEDIGL
ncbi:MAG: HDIG domain-containing protein [Candidatus Pacebacteria bacterium]|nr:HDIG domain-containing protein [Candidatus Paceibacterota bacterium]